MHRGVCPADSQKNNRVKSIEVLTMNECTRTGTLRWVITTVVSLPRTAIAVCPEPEMALKAYSRDAI